MKRNCALEDISDGNLYQREDLVTVSCNGCKGNASCCRGMGTSIILDPYDIFRLTAEGKCNFEELLKDKIELNLVDGIILPNLKMAGEGESCAYLREDGRCSIHTARPGICRLFPLGRVYENGGFHYFLQKNECQNPSKTMMKVSKWLDTPDLPRYEQFVVDWHYFLKEMENFIQSTQEEKLVKTLNMLLLNTFYVRPYDGSREFYLQFYDRLTQVKRTLQLDD